MTARMLIAGVGNIFLGDDGFGAEVARRLAETDLPGWVRVADYGISGMHLAYDLAEGYETTVLVDASPRGGEPGTVYVLEVDAGGPPAAGVLDAHGMQPDVVFSMLGLLGGHAGRVLVVGCEPASVDEGIGLSAPVAAAVDEAVRVVLDLVRAAAPAVPAGQPPAGSGRRSPSSARSDGTNADRRTEKGTTKGLIPCASAYPVR